MTKTCLAAIFLALAMGGGPSFGANPDPASVAKTPAAAPDANKKTPPAPPPPVPDTFNRYGKIWAPSDDVAHPLKLNIQFPGVGELKIPSQEELNVREKLEQLGVLSDAEIRTQLEQWPPYNQMSLRDDAQFLGRIQQFKDMRSKIARDKAHDLGLTLTPQEQARFEKEYWDKKLEVDRELARQFEPVFKARENKMKEELFRSFSTPGVAGAPPQPPKAAAPAQAKAMAPPATTPSGKPAPAPGTNSPMPVAQAPR